MKLRLPNVTLILCDCLNTDRSIKVLEHCKSRVDFGAVKFLTSLPCDYEHRVEIMPLNSLIAYSIFMLTKVYQYVETEKMLLVQRDGWILNPQSWDNSWNELDYIGGLFMQYNKVGSGGFSYRSKALMEYMASITPQWDGTQQEADRIQQKLNCYEDGEICFGSARNKFKIASLEQAANFSQAGNRDKRYFREYPFGYHRSWQKIDFKTGRVDSSDTTRDITAGYDNEIDML